MARPLKMGIDYFPLDVDIFDDEKVIPVSSEYGAKGDCITIRVLCAIYRNGYFAECSEAFKFKIAKQANLSHQLVSDVISGLVKWGFFDKSVFDSFGILTSKGIQERWKEATRKRVPKNKLGFWIIDEKKQENELLGKDNEFLPEETPLIPPESTQKKRKEKKLKNNSSRIRKNAVGKTLNSKAKILFEEHFKDVYTTDYYWTAKDAGNMKQLLDKLRFQREQKKLECSDDGILSALAYLLKSIDSGWIFENFSVPNINSKFNEIISNAKSKQKGVQSKQSHVVDI